MNYIGSKYSLIDFLTSTIAEVTQLGNEPIVFADLFSGTGIVGATYRKMGHQVIANDIQYYSYVINKHLIENREILLNKELLTHLNTLKEKEGFVYQNYCLGSGSQRNYFTDENGKKCDAIRIELEYLLTTGQINEATYYYYLASLINSIDKYANTASVYGAFLKHTKKQAQKSFYLEPLPIINGIVGTVYNLDVNVLIKEVSGDILYLDPPYNARQYGANYHVLETIARYDHPTLKGVTGLRDYNEQKSNYCSKRLVAESLDALIKEAKFEYIFLSYNNEGLLSLDEIERIMSQYGDYRCFTKAYRRFLADSTTNRQIKGHTTTEYLHCLKKPRP